MTKASTPTYYRRLCESLLQFFPGKEAHFLCPTCLSSFGEDETDEHGEPRKTEAHLVPQAAGGREYTFTCKRCNSSCGTSQDKWLGEYLQIVENGSNPLAGRTKVRKFDLNGVLLNGEIRMSEDDAIEVYIYNNKNNPKHLAQFFEDTTPRSMEVKFPIGGHMREVRVGALTTAYLTLFYHFGYSWVLQDHLDPVRSQILNPTEEQLPNTFCTLFKEKIWAEPWLGFLEIGEMLCIGYGYSNFLVLFPPADQLNFYERLKPPRKLGDLGNRLILPLAKSQSLPPYILLFEHRMMMLPNAALKKGVAPDIILFPGGSRSPVFRKSSVVGDEFVETDADGKITCRLSEDHSSRRVSLNTRE